jgi:hypothetical protein
MIIVTVGGYTECGIIRLRTSTVLAETKKGCRMNRGFPSLKLE